MASQPGEATVYAGEEVVPLEPLLDGYGAYRYSDVTRIEVCFLCPQCDTEQILEVEDPPLAPNQSYPCHTCDHQIHFTPELERQEETPREELTFGQRTLRRVVPFSNRIAPLPDDDDEDEVYQPTYHIEHLLNFMIEMSVRREVRLLGQQNPSSWLGVMMRLRTTERIRFGVSVGGIWVLLLVGLWLIPSVSMNFVTIMALTFLCGLIIYAATEMPLIPHLIIRSLRDDYDISEYVDGSVFMEFGDYYRYGHQLALGETPDPIEPVPVEGVPHTTELREDTTNNTTQPPEQSGQHV